MSLVAEISNVNTLIGDADTRTQNDRNIEFRLGDLFQKNVSVWVFLDRTKF